MITVVNKHTIVPDENDFYIGRGSPLGNPYTSKVLKNTKAIYQCSSPEESVNKFEQYLRKEILNKNKIICDYLNKIYLKVKKK